MEQEQARIEVFRRLREHHEWQRATLGPEVPTWVGELCTRVAVLIDDEQIQFFGGHLSETDSTMAGELMIFTPSRLIRAKSTSRRSDGESTVWMVSRSTLIRVDIDGGLGLFDNSHWGPSWPGDFSLSLTYPGDKITLPGYDHRDQDDPFNVFFPSLLADLDRIAPYGTAVPAE